MLLAFLMTVLTGVLLLVPTSSQSSGSCSTVQHVQHEITSDCGGLCDVCVVFDAAADCTNCVTDGQDTCQYLCFHAADFTVAVTIGFGEYQSNEEVEARKTDSNYDVEVAAVSYGAEVSNDNVSAVGPLTLSSNVTELSIAGGNEGGNDYVKGKVVNVSFGSDLISSQEQVTIVTLASINLGEAVDNLASMLPSNLSNVVLSNCLLTEFPSQLSDMGPLYFLDLNGNYLTRVENESTLFSVTNLDLKDNNLASFEGNFFNNLESVTLSNNALTAIPKVLVNNQKLTNIDLDGNAIHAVNSSFYWKNLDILSLNGNGIESFEAVLPMLGSLYLRNHNLSKIPTAIYELSHLSELDLRDGKRKLSTRINQTQFDFLTNLTTLYASQDDFDIQASCEGSPKNITVTNIYDARFHVAVCVGDFINSASSSTTPNASDTSSNETRTGLIVGVLVGVLIVVVVVAVFVWRMKYRRNQYPSDDSDTILLWRDDEMLQLLLRPEDIQDVKKIESGAWGDVWLVKYRDSQLCAAKRLRKDHTTKDTNRAFADEIKLVAKFDHPNIVRLIGAAWTVATDLQALFEYMEGGDLRDYLVDASTPREWTPQKVRIATDVIDALVYVHSFDPPVVHRDLKSRNVLLSTLSDEEADVSGELRAKLTDFGSSRYKSLEDTMTRGVGTARWLAPEVLSSRSYGPSADIFSFGVVLSELDTHALPYDGECSSDGSPLSDVAILQKVAMGTLRPRFGGGCPTGLRELADRCLSVNADDRPHAPEIAYGLRTLARSWIARQQQ